MIIGKLYHPLPRNGISGGQSVILPVKLGNQSDKSKESSQSAKGYS